MDLTLDFEYGRTPLFVRQTVATAFGITLGQEFTWDSLANLVRDAVRASPPRSIRVLGLPYLDMVIPEEARCLSVLLRELEKEHPEIRISMALNR